MLDLKFSENIRSTIPTRLNMGESGLFPFLQGVVER